LVPGPKSEKDSFTRCAHRTKVAQHIILKKMFYLNPKAYTQGPCPWGLYF
jgi:hypothetical protein